jgi:surface protein
MFNSAAAFNQNIGGWNTGAATNMQAMFANNLVFNNGGSSSIGGWNTANVTNMQSMFSANPAFNQDISGWNTIKVTSMLNMFLGATAFNQNIGGWNTGAVTSMTSMFSNATAFNQDISGWNVNKVTTFNTMFSGSTAFNQNLGSWALKTTATLPTFVSIFANSGMSCANYTDTIVGWANYVNTNSAPKSRTMSLQTGRVFANDRSGGAAFADSGAARTYLTGALPDGGWTISGDTVQASC